MRLMIMDDGPALLSRLSSAHAVLRPTPRMPACLSVVSKPADIKAARISASFKACLAFAFDCGLSCRLSAAPQGRFFVREPRKRKLNGGLSFKKRDTRRKTATRGVSPELWQVAIFLVAECSFRGKARAFSRSVWVIFDTPEDKGLGSAVLTLAQ